MYVCTQCKSPPMVTTCTPTHGQLQFSSELGLIPINSVIVPCYSVTAMAKSCKHYTKRQVTVAMKRPSVGKHPKGVNIKPRTKKERGTLSA